MAILTDTEKAKTLAEYLGITGTREEIQEKMETDKRVKEFLEKHIGYDVSSSIDYKDKKGYYPFLIRELMFHEKLDENDRPIVDLNQLTPKTIGEIVDDPDKLRVALRKQYTDIQSDCEESSGTKFQRFKDSIDFDSVVEGSERDYFFRFWRAPITRLLKDRGIDVSTETGKDKATDILQKLYDPRTQSSKITTLLTEWPEHLVEDHDIIEQRDRTTEHQRALDEEALKYKPFYETLEKFAHVRFSDTSNVDLMAQEAFAEEEAKRELAKILKTNETLDEQAFRETITMMPHQIEHDAESIKGALMWRNDKDYIAKNPSVPFSKFLEDRRKDLPFGEDAKNKTLRTALEIVIGTGPVDNKAVKLAMNEPCDKLKADADLIIHDTARRKSRRRWIVAGISTLAALGLFWSGKSALSSNPKEPKPTKAPTAQRPIQTADKQVAKPQQKAPAQAVQAPAPAVAATNMVQKALDGAQTNATATAAQATTNAVDTAQTPAKPTEIIGKKGNHLIALHWTGYKDIDYHQVMEDAPDLVFKTHFDYMKKRIQDTGLPFADLFKPEFTSRALKKVHNYIWLKPVGTNKEIRFYIHPDGRVRDAITEDVLSFYMNCRDVLQSLPVAKENLPMAQVKVMEALGPAMGWSTKQQLAWQKMHPWETQNASSIIAEMTRAGIQEHKTDTNNMEAVFMEVVEAARVYGEKHPDHKALLLSIDDVARSFASMGREDMAKYDQLAPQNTTEAHKHIEGMHKIEEAERIEQERQKQAEIEARRSASKSDSSGGGFPWKTTLAVGAIAYLWGRKKRRGG